MPIDRSDYGPYWYIIAHEVKSAAGWRCEWCQVPHFAIIRRNPKDRSQWRAVRVVLETNRRLVRADRLTQSRLKFHGLVRVIITTAHLDRNSHNHDRNNLAALCQRCHLRYDIRQHIANRRYGRHHTKDHQLTLPFDAAHP